MRTTFRTALGLGAALAVVGMVGTASADPAGWTANPGTSYDSGVVTLDSTGGGTSYEHAALEVPVENGDTISFEYTTADVACAGGTPRVFIQGGAYNTFDADPAGEGACGTDSDNDGWYTVTGTLAGITSGNAGYTGIVNDNPSDPGTVQVRNLIISGVNVFEPASAAACKNGGWEGFYKNQGECVSSFAKDKNGE